MTAGTHDAHSGALILSREQEAAYPLLSLLRGLLFPFLFLFSELARTHARAMPFVWMFVEHSQLAFFIQASHLRPCCGAIVSSMRCCRLNECIALWMDEREQLKGRLRRRVIPALLLGDCTSVHRGRKATQRLGAVLLHPRIAVWNCEL
jgi:apolipoprotein N-acyltransferase